MKFDYKKGLVILKRIIKKKEMCTQAKENTKTVGKSATNRRQRKLVRQDKIVIKKVSFETEISNFFVAL